MLQFPQTCPHISFYKPPLYSFTFFNSLPPYCSHSLFLYPRLNTLLHPYHSFQVPTSYKSMCSSKSKLHRAVDDNLTSAVVHINGRPVLQPTCNRVNRTLERRHSLKKATPNPPIPQPQPPLSSIINTKTKNLSTPPISPKSKSKSPTIPTTIKRAKSDLNELNSSLEKVVTSPSPSPSINKCASRNSSSSLIVEAPGSIAATRREQVASMQEQRKNRIAHYGRTKSAKYERRMVVPILDSSSAISSTTAKEEKRCSFITPNSDPVYVAYHDEEWGVPVHDDKMLFELLVLTSAQVGSDWTSVLKKRPVFREAFAGFDAKIVAKFTEKKIASISTGYGMDLNKIRGVVDNANKILEIKRVFGSFDVYLWEFIKHKPIANNYKTCHKIPVKTSKSEAISKDMVRRGFRFVGPTALHSFMEAAGLTNDHLITCPRYLQCIALASRPSCCVPCPIN